MKLNHTLLLATFMAAILTSSRASVTSASFGQLPDGRSVTIFTLRNTAGAEARITNYGGIVVSLVVPDRAGHPVDVVLGYDHLDGYLKKTPYFGALIGRYGNRIAKGRFVLGDQTCQLAVNDGTNALHGGLQGFDKVVWAPRPFDGPHGPSLELTYHSPDGDGGYPGALDVTATYTLTGDNGLQLEFTARTDKPTVLNLTHHSYFNLNGEGTILDHVVTLPASRFTPVDATLIPTGELRSVAGTPFDFRQPTAIGARITQADDQLKAGGGYDHNWVVDKPAGELALHARVVGPGTGIVLEVFSTEPGVQFYSGNFLDGTITGKRGTVYAQRSGFCLEPQHFPDSPNQPGFPSVVLRPGQVYHNTIVYRLSTGAVTPASPAK